MLLWQHNNDIIIWKDPIICHTILLICSTKSPTICPCKLVLLSVLTKGLNYLSNQKGTVIFPTKRIFYQLWYQKGIIIYNGRRVKLDVIPKVCYYMSYQKDQIICLTKKVLLYVLPKGSDYLSYQKGPIIFPTKRVILFVLTEGSY